LKCNLLSEGLNKKYEISERHNIYRENNGDEMIPKSFLSSEKFYEEYQNIVNFAPFKDDFIQNEINKIKTEFESTLKKFEANQKDQNENDNRRRNLSTKLRNMKQELFISELEVCSSEMLEMKLDELNFQVNLK